MIYYILYLVQLLLDSCIHIGGSGVLSKGTLTTWGKPGVEPHTLRFMDNYPNHPITPGWNGAASQKIGEQYCFV